MRNDTLLVEMGPEGQSFSNFIWHNKWNRAFTLIGVFAFVLQFIFFKFLYPYANYFVDSYYYLEAAAKNVDVNTWPVAYSKFLRIFSAFTHSDTILVGFQYFFIQFSGLYLFFTLLYFFKPGKAIMLILYAFFLFNPIALYIANYISADALFIGLSLLWITQLIWIICRPNRWQLLTQAILLLLVFTVRYNAIYYPIIAALAFVLSRQGIWTKIAGIALGTGFVAFSIFYTSNKMLQETGKRQFSAFGGWQLANNALYGYEHVKPEKPEQLPARFASLQTLVKQHMDTLGRMKFTHEDTLHTFFYLWSHRGPLMQYMSQQWKKDSTTSYFKKWSTEGPLFADYGFYLIRKHPMEFAQYFLWPNALKYATPPIEFLGVYNMGEDSVDREAKDWFNYKSQRISHHYKDHEVTSLRYYPVFTAIANLLFVIGLIAFLVFQGAKKASPGYSKVLILILAFWLVNMGFSIFASPVVLRYQLFPVILSFAFALLTIRFVDLKQ